MKTFKNLMALGAIGLATAVICKPVHAMETGRDIFAGVQLGFTQVSNNVGTGIGFGAEAGYFFSGPFGVGLYIRHGNHSNNISSNFYGAEGFYKLDMLLSGLRAAAILGAGSFSSNGIGGNSAMEVGGKLAYDHSIPCEYPITVGADVGLTFTKPGDSMLTMFTPMLTAKWWF